MINTPTIYEVLRERLGREPTNAELNNEVKRIIFDCGTDREFITEKHSDRMIPRTRD
jgi:hypothetical protein